MMNGKQIALSVVLADFAALTAYAVYQYGYLGVFAILMANSATWLAIVDLTIALTMVLAWMWNDARERGTSFVPYAVLTLVFGSVGPLLYLIRRFGNETVARQAVLRGSPAARSA